MKTANRCITSLPEESNISVKKRQLSQTAAVVLLIIVLLITFLLSLNIGRYQISFSQIVAVFTDSFLKITGSYPETLSTVLFNIRIPRILTALLVGSALTSSGAAYQGIFKNPMVSPDILGAAAGAGFGAALAILFSFGTVGIQISAFVFGMFAVMLTYIISNVIGRENNVILILVLTGMVVETLFSSLTSVIKYVADPDSKLPEITFWLMGSLSRVIGMGDVLKLSVPVIIGSVPLLLLRWKINVLSFGDEEATALGIDTKLTRLVIIISATLLTSAAISVSGMVGWIGLIVPHAARLIVGPNYRRLMPVSMLMGGIFLLLVDDAARSILSVEIPLGILTAIIGAPFFLVLLLKGKNDWG